MSVLASLKFSNIKKPTHLAPILIRRNKLIKKLVEQIELATALSEGRTYTATRLRYYKDTETGVTRSIEAPKRVKTWWWTSDTGRICVNLRYGSKHLSFGKGKNCVEVGTGEQLIATLNLLKKAVEAGELDTEIEAASGALKANFSA